MLKLWLLPFRIWIEAAGTVVEAAPKPPRRLYPKGSYFGEEVSEAFKEQQETFTGHME